MGGNFKNLGDPFYTSRDNRFKIYRDGAPDEHQMVVDGTHYVGLVRGTLNGVARGEKGAIGYVMEQLLGVNVLEVNVVQALLRGRISELEEHTSTLIKENFDLQNKDN